MEEGGEMRKENYLDFYKKNKNKELRRFMRAFDITSIDRDTFNRIIIALKKNNISDLRDLIYTAQRKGYDLSPVISQNQYQIIVEDIADNIVRGVVDIGVIKRQLGIGKRVEKVAEKVERRTRKSDIDKLLRKANRKRRKVKRRKWKLFETVALESFYRKEIIANKTKRAEAYRKFIIVLNDNRMPLRSYNSFVSKLRRIKKK